jgi:hypothetical protein
MWWRRAVLLFIVVAETVVLPAVPSWSASRQIGGTGLGFSCDVDTQKCECKGVETGADCVGMKKNCAGSLTCLDPITYPGQPYRCFCSMSKAARPSGIRPKINETMKLAPE